MGEQLNDDLREQGRAVWETKLHSVPGCPFEVTLHNNKKKTLSLYVGVFAHALLCV